MFWALPEIRRGWWAVAALVNPTLVMAPIIGQLPFLWATAFFFAAIGCWRRDRRIAAVVLLTVSQATHPAILMPIAFLVVAAWLPWERNKRALLVGYGIAVVASLPFAYLVFDSPVMEDTSLGVKIANFAATLAVRLFVVAAPLGAGRPQAHRRPTGCPRGSCAAASSPTPSAPWPSPSS